MKLTIIPVDGSIGKNGKFYLEIDLSSCGIPSDVHALQWQDTAGWIEYESATVQNQDITELPTWATACVTKWDELYNVEQTKIAEAARIEAEQTAQQRN
jgi:hypothetical protein